MSKHSTSGRLIALAIGLVGIATIEHWMPIWIALWQFGLALAFRTAEVIL